MGYLRTFISTGAIFPATLSFSSDDSSETLGQRLSVNVESYFLTMWAGHPESHPSSETLLISALSSHAVVAIFSSVAGYKRTSALNEWRVGFCVSGSIDNTSIYLADMYNNSYMVCDFENVALGHKPLHPKSS